MNWLDKHQEKILIFTWTLIFLTSLFVIFTNPVKAESPSSLPYYVNQNVPFEVPFSFNDVVEGAFNNPNYNITSATGLTKEDVLNCDNYLLICNYYAPTYITFQYHILIENTYSIALSNNNYDSFVAGTDTVNLTFNGYNQNLGKYITLGVTYNPEVYTWVNSGFGYNNFSTVKVFNSNNNYPLNYPFAIKQDFVIGNDDNVVLGNYFDPVINTGHATPPIDDQGHYIPNVNPNKPTITPFIPSSPTFPSIDTTNLESLVESLIDFVEYGFTYVGGLISGWFSNLLSNIDNLFDYVVQSFNRGFNNVVGAIQDLATDFYNNMVSLFEPIYDFLSSTVNFFNHLIEIGTVDGVFNLTNIVTYLFVPDSATLYPIFVSHDEFNIIGITNHLFSEYQLLMSRVESINALHYILIPSFSFHGQTIPQTRIDFSWFDDYKVYTDGVISAFLIVGYIYFLFTRISGWLRGNQGDVYVGDNSSNYHGTKIGF